MSEVGRQRGLAMGLNEFAGYGAMSLAALASGYLATSYGIVRGDGQVRD